MKRLTSRKIIGFIVFKVSRQQSSNPGDTPEDTVQYYSFPAVLGEPYSAGSHVRQPINLSPPQIALVFGMFEGHAQPFSGVIPDCTQELLPAVSGDHMECPRIESRQATCKTSASPTKLSLCPQKVLNTCPYFNMNQNRNVENISFHFPNMTLIRDI